MNTRQILSIAVATIMFIVILVLATFYQSAKGVVKLSGEQVQLTNEQDVRLKILEQQLEQDNSYRVAQLDALNTLQQLETLEMALRQSKAKFLALESSAMRYIITKRTTHQDVYEDKHQQWYAHIENNTAFTDDFRAQAKQSHMTISELLTSGFNKFAKRNKYPAIQLLNDQIIPQIELMHEHYNQELNQILILKNTHQSTLMEHIHNIKASAQESSQARDALLNIAANVSTSSLNIADRSHTVANIARNIGVLILVIFPLAGWRFIVFFVSPLKNAEAHLITMSKTNDLTMSLPNAWGEIEKMLTALRHFIRSIRHSIYSVSGCARTISQQAKDLDTVVNEAVDRASSQQAHLQTLDNHKNTQLKTAQTCLSVMEQSQIKLQQCNDVVGRTNIAINSGMNCFKQINTAITPFHQHIKVLTASVTKITEFTHSIDAISRQSNLLAVNAAVEAARSRNDGKGFAVVATEIRKLAKQSAGASQDIRRYVDELGNIISDVTSCIHNAQITADKGQQVSSNMQAEIDALMLVIKGIRGDVTRASDQAKYNFHSVQEGKAVIEQLAIMMNQTAIANNKVKQHVYDSVAHANDLQSIIQDYKFQPK